ncbi:hypothetical protein K7X08_009365 [Anisodus acutangulus]|uniref:Uncharacterized protein n=1 Tax=Anisodus acutangulus TaxID=402998 RepID=A0A9Q1RTF3_9SOLA|nr:hypothetical protein K7X08_009365 [Anisodus acutangulus]
MLEAAKSTEIRKVLLRYLELQGSVWPMGPAISHALCFGTECWLIIIDTTCATFAEVQKRGKDFWAEFELYAADMLVGVAVNVALVGLLAPYARIWQPSVSQGFIGRLQSVFEAERPGCRM